MPGKRRSPRDNRLTERFLSDDQVADSRDEKEDSTRERFSDRSKSAERNKIIRTTESREVESQIGLDTLPVGEVVQVYSRYYDVEFQGTVNLCVTRKTLSRTSDTQIVVGDRVRFSVTGSVDESNRPEGVIEQVLPRQTILTRAESFRGLVQHPIVANAEQILIVASVREPMVKWGLVDRMLIAAQSGGLKAIICLNKMDLLDTGGVESAMGADERVPPVEALLHFRSMGIVTLQTSVSNRQGLDELRDLLKDRATVVAGHSGVGKSSLLRAIQPGLDIRVGEVSTASRKGRHTTSSAKRYGLDFGGHLIDTPGVKMLGLWNVSRDNLGEFFPDIAAGSPPYWRKESYNRIAASLRT